MQAERDRAIATGSRIKELIDKSKELADRTDSGQPPDPTADTLSAMMEKAKKSTKPLETDQADEIFRQVQVQEREREQIDRDITRDRGGPSR